MKESLHGKLILIALLVAILAGWTVYDWSQLEERSTLKMARLWQDGCLEGAFTPSRVGVNRVLLVQLPEEMWGEMQSEADRQVYMTADLEFKDPVFTIDGRECRVLKSVTLPVDVWWWRTLRKGNFKRKLPTAGPKAEVWKGIFEYHFGGIELDEEAKSMIRQGITITVIVDADGNFSAARTLAPYG